MREKRHLLCIGVLTPHVTPGPEVEFPMMAPGALATRLVRVSDPARMTSALGDSTAAPIGLDQAAEALANESIDVVAYASTTSAYAIGFDAETALVSRLALRLAVPVVSTGASAVRALRVLGIERVALIGAPWFEPESNDLGARYFRSQGFDVVSSRSADLAHDPDRIEPAAIVEWTLRHMTDDCEAIFIGGNGFRASGAIERLELATGRPVFTANQVLLWDVLAHTGSRCEIGGYGCLFEPDRERAHR